MAHPTYKFIPSKPRVATGISIKYDDQSAPSICDHSDLMGERSGKRVKRDLACYTLRAMYLAQPLCDNYAPHGIPDLNWMPQPYETVTMSRIWPRRPYGLVEDVFYKNRVSPGNPLHMKRDNQSPRLWIPAVGRAAVCRRRKKLTYRRILVACGAYSVLRYEFAVTEHD
jgi:hypothetical protein